MDDLSQTGPEPGYEPPPDAASDWGSVPDAASTQSADGGLDESSLAEYPLPGGTIADTDAPSAAHKPARLRRLPIRLPRLRRPALDTRRRKLTAIGVAVLAVAVAAGAFAAVPRAGGGGPIASASGLVSDAPTVPPSGPQSSLSAGTAGSPPATPGGGASPHAIPSQTAATAAITFTNVVLDSKADAARTARTFTFTSDGPGAVSAEIVSSSPSNTSRVCVAVDDAAAICQEGVAPGLSSMITRTEHSRWTVTLTSANEGSPTVDVAFRWPAVRPSIRLTYGRFQGSPNPDSLRSVQATFKPRSAGLVTLDASWDGPAVAASVALEDVSTVSPVTLDLVRYPAGTSISPAYSHSIAAGKLHRIELLNESADASRPNLTATIAFP